MRRTKVVPLWLTVLQLYIISLFVSVSAGGNTAAQKSRGVKTLYSLLHLQARKATDVFHQQCVCPTEPCQPSHCAGLAAHQCRTCLDVLLRLKNNTICEPGTFYSLTKSVCLPCNPGCRTCTGAEQKNCSSCLPGFHLLDGTCQSRHTCREGEYLNEYHSCFLCDTTCLWCNGPGDTDCSKCPPNRYLQEGRCTLHCPKGCFPLDGLCHRCHHTCAECLSEREDACTMCSQDMFGRNRYLFQGFCVEKCSPAHFPSQQNTCYPCPENCMECNSSQWCLTCNASYMLNNGSCIKPECGEGEVADPEYEDCMPCELGCKQCVLYNPKHCLSCSETFYRFQESCFENCPVKTFSTVNRTCVKCEENCISCEGEECYWCEADHFLSGGRCVRQCEKGFYGDEDSQECKPCHASCRTCFESGLCESCEEDQWLENGKCVAGGICPQFSFLNERGICEFCHSTCQSCWGRGRSQCSTCVRGRFLSAQHMCVGACPTGSFASTASGRCERCSPGCARCVSHTRCLRCVFVQNTFLYLQDGDCVSQCERGFPVGLLCETCHPRCASCENIASHCTSCISPFLLNGQQCVEACPEAHVLRAGVCTECENTTLWYPDGCVYTCPRGFYPNIARRTCEVCHHNCLLCGGPNPNECLSCEDPGMVLHGGECQPECPAGMYHDTHMQECRGCDMSCLSCSGPSTTACLSCQDNFHLDERNRCIHNCPARFYMHPDQGCLRCHRHCLRCMGPKSKDCLQCHQPSLLLNGSCVRKCPLGFFIDRMKQRCEHCHQACLSCLGGQSHQCLICKPHLFWEDNVCVQSCKSSRYGNVSTGVCELCDLSCAECKSSGETHCYTCREGFYYLSTQGRCLSICPHSYYKDQLDRACQLCHSSCLTCSGEGSLACQSCLPGYILSGGSCKHVCLMGQYPVSESCLSCHQSCMECTGDGVYNCSACHGLDVLSATGQCVSCCVTQGQTDCCNCSDSRECILTSITEHKHSHSSGLQVLAVIAGVLLFVGLLGAALISRHTCRRHTHTDPHTYVQWGRHRWEQQDEDTVYVTQHGVVYRKFSYTRFQGEEEEERSEEEGFSF